MNKLFIIFLSIISLSSKVLAHENESFLVPPDWLIFRSPVLSIGILVVIALAIYFLLAYIVKIKLPKIPLSNQSLKNLLAAVLFLGTSAWYWDGWWHIARGIDMFFSPPHVLVYVAHTLLILSTLYLYNRTKSKFYYYVLMAEGVTYFSGFVDIFWHGYFGLEKEVTPLMVWSPSHIVSFSSILVGILILLHNWIKEYKNDPKVEDLFRLILVSGAGFSILSIITLSPLHPLGWHHIFGPWGVVFTSFFSMLYVLYIAYHLPKTGIVTFSAMIVYCYITFESFTTAPGVVLLPHSTAPFWLHFLSIIIGVIWIDFINIKNKSIILIGTTAGFLTGFIYFCFWSLINNNTFSYSFNDSFIFLMMSMVGGTVAGLIVDIIFKKRYKNLFKFIFGMNKKFLLILLLIIIFLVGFGYGYMFNHYNDQQNKLSIATFLKHDPYGQQSNSINLPHTYEAENDEILNSDSESIIVEEKGVLT
ncbi:MAG: hypothetical protein Q7S27_06460 [Nanoarchaeota archaeon]|nr:hypothetical protein [Nanoarchaeota archaeon]